MDLQRFLDKCRSGQWQASELDLGTPPPMTREEEIEIVQYLTDMAEVERLAGALFEVQRAKVADPVLKEVLAICVRDEARHARVASMLAAHYDVHRHRTYRVTESLARFAPTFERAMRAIEEDVAASYIFVGELILDMAHLRCLADLIDDDACERAMEKINQDESRHLAVDYYMAEYYCSAAYLEELTSRPRVPLRDRAIAWWTLADLLRRFRPVFREVFFEPMKKIDPSGVRLREAFKRIQLLGAKAEMRRRPFSRFMLGMMDLYNRPAARVVLGPILERLTGIDGELLLHHYDHEEKRRAERMSFDEHCAEAVAHRPSSRTASSIRRRMRSVHSSAS